jgi:hypothetical protein
MRTLLTFGPLVLLTAVLGCGDATESEVLLGTWYLQSYNDSAMPGTAVFRSANDSSLMTIDSARLVLDDGATCTWLVHLAATAPALTDECAWTLDAGPDDILVTILATYTLRGSASAGQVLVRDPNDNLLVFGRDPAEGDPIEPEPAARGDLEGGAVVSRLDPNRGH